MAVSSTSSATGSSLDVASIVSGLMEIEKKPLTVLETKIAASDTKISLLGQFQSKLSSVQAALTALQTPSNFTGAVTSSSSAVATAVATANVQAGRYNLVVAKTAEAAQTNITGFDSSSASLSGTDYRFTVGGTTYQPVVGDNVTTLTGLRDWINAEPTLKDKVQASILQSSSGAYVLSLRGLSVGADNALVTEVQSPTGSGTWAAVTPYQQAQDAQFSLNGVQFVRASNTVTDAVAGMTLSLVQTGSSVLQASNTDSTQAKALLTALVTAYNDLLDFYKIQTASSADQATRGLLNSDFSVASVMRQLQTAMASKLTNSSGFQLQDPLNAVNTQAQYMDLLGLEFSSSGQLVLNDTLFGRSTQLQSVLASGIKIGFDSGSLKDLSQSIASMLDINGAVYERVQSENQVQRDLAQKKTNLEEKLARVQQQYTAQYAALDALLYKLNSTSDSLKSALDGLTASQKNN